jgi:hypothetical protein
MTVFKTIRAPKAPWPYKDRPKEKKPKKVFQLTRQEIKKLYESKRKKP